MFLYNKQKLYSTEEMNKHNKILDYYTNKFHDIITELTRALTLPLAADGVTCAHIES